MLPDPRVQLMAAKLAGTITTPVAVGRASIEGVSPLGVAEATLAVTRHKDGKWSVHGPVDVVLDQPGWPTQVGVFVAGQWRWIYNNLGKYRDKGDLIKTYVEILLP